MNVNCHPHLEHVVGRDHAVGHEIHHEVDHEVQIDVKLLANHLKVAGKIVKINLQWNQG